MIRPHPFHGQHFEPCFHQKLSAVGFIEYVVMKTAVLKICLRPLAKLLHRTSIGILAEVVCLQDLGKMGQIVFLSISKVIFNHMCDGRRRSPMVERPGGIGKHQDQAAVRPRDALPLLQGSNRVGMVLKTMGRQNEIVCTVGNNGNIGAFATDQFAGGLARAESIAFLMVCPCRGARIIAIIQRSDLIVERQCIGPVSKDFAGAPDFEAGLTLHQRYGKVVAAQAPSKQNMNMIGELLK